MRFTFLARYALPAYLAVALCQASGPAPADSPLIDALKRHDDKAFAVAMKGHPDVNKAQPDGATALSWAAYLNDDAAADVLLKAGAKVNVADEYGETPLTLACANGDGALVKKLIDAGADATVARWNGETALMIASRAGSADAVKLLLAHGAKVDATDNSKGQNALMWAAAAGHADVADVLIAAGAKPNMPSKGGFTPLIFAAQHGDANTVANLLKAGADVKYMAPQGADALMVAVMGSKNDTVKELLNNGASVAVKDRQGNTPLHIAAQLGDLDSVKMLLAKGADANAKTNVANVGRGRGGGGGGFFRIVGGQTPLMLAAKANKEEVMKALVAAGADPKATAQDGSNLLMAAAGTGHVEITQYAFELDPDIKTITDDKRTVMHAAVNPAAMQTSTQPEICKVVQFLADKGAALDEKDANGRTPISIANVLPIDEAVTLLTKLIVATGKQPQISGAR
jgi:ankyrin repeat protein